MLVSARSCHFREVYTRQVWKSRSVQFLRYSGVRHTDTRTEIFPNHLLQLMFSQLGTMTEHAAQLHLKGDPKPRFWRPQPVPFALKAVVKAELD